MYFSILIAGTLVLLVLSQGEEVHVDGTVGHRVILDRLEDGLMLGTFDVEVHDVGIRGMGETFELFLVNGERDVLDTGSVDDARDAVFSADALDIGFLAGDPLLSLKFEMFHCVWFKNVLLKPGTGPGPHCTKRFPF